MPLACALSTNSLNFSSANFACGKVINEENYSVSWLSVMVNFADQPNKTTRCQISPENYKYCCDTDDIKGVSWAKGKIITAEIFNNQSNYFASSESTLISGEGFDVFPDLLLRKAINLNFPNKIIYVNETDLFINISLEYPFNRLEVILDSEKVNSCSNCSNFESLLENMTYGSHRLKFVAFDQRDRAVERVIDFYFLKYLNLDREILCSKGCIGQFILSRGGNITMKLLINSSHDIVGRLFDYFPNDWKVLDSRGGEVGQFSDTHNYISWDFNGSYGERSYVLNPPSIFLTRYYEFQSKLENYLASVDDVYLYLLYRIKFLALREFYNNLTLKEETFIYANKDAPLVYFPNKTLIRQIAIFPKAEEHDIKFSFFEEQDNYFSFSSSLANKDIDKILIDFMVNKSLVDDDSTVYLYHKLSAEKVDIQHVEKINEDSDYFYFRATTAQMGGFFINWSKNE